MATSGKICIKCDKSGGIFTCDGCKKSFCGQHTAAHRQELSHQLDVIGQEHDLLRRDLTNNTGKDLILDQINVWGKESIVKIINAETSDLHPSVMCTSKSKNEHPRFFRFYFALNILYHAQQS